MTVDTISPTPSANGVHRPIESPALAVGANEDAYELKFQLPAASAGVIESWARQRLRPDPHGRDGVYHVTTVYLDTPLLDVFHRSAGYRRSKHRLRRYEATPFVFLEQKIRRGDRVRKRRSGVPQAELACLNGVQPLPGWAGEWFLRRLDFRQLQPTCRIAYDRTAFLGLVPEGPIRLTLDRNILGVPAQGWDVPPLYQGRPLLPGGILVEIKFPTSLPTIFRELLPLLPPSPARVSKYRLCVQAWDLAAGMTTERG